MQVVLWCFRTVLFSLVASIVGGFVAGAVHSAVDVVSDPPPLSSIADFVIFVLPVMFVSGVGGMYFGLWLGLVPTFVFGACLSILKFRKPFEHGVTWVATGAAAGLAMQYVVGVWAVAWVVGGAVSAWTYWGLDTGMFARRGFGWVF